MGHVFQPDMKPHVFVPQLPPKAAYCALCAQHKKDATSHPKPKRMLNGGAYRDLMLDLNGGDIVQVQVSTNPDGTETLWVNIDGVCRLRVSRPNQIIVSDERRKNQ